MKRLCLQEVNCCFGCPNYSDLDRQCQAEPKPIKIPPDFDVSQDVFNHCPLPDFDIIEILSNPNPSFWVAKGKRRLTKKQQNALAHLKHIAQLLKAENAGS
jgi:hypothetical protein